ncbi:hypothetical protein N657DRAFT_693709 [Parathielavia appendiculata]|uniref:Uncharacterized protein n=1 Tax=Parathielavia appendiculata TaxID=2587402 RepID=A0AAN6TRP9_9PEZI|nr:hypothetical protein N657DRAFT_693709 [Parathielavia appendiculata]
MRASNILTIIFPLMAHAALNGRCTGSAADGVWGESGICIRTSTCRSYGGISKQGACPYDADDVRCCVIGRGGNAANDPCGPVSWCDWTSAGNACQSVGGIFDPGHCPGGSNFQCCRNYPGKKE